MTPADPHDAASGVPPEVGAFLEGLRAQAARIPRQTPLPAAPPADLRAVRPDEDLAARFVSAAQSAGCVVHAADRDNWTDVALRVLRKLDGPVLVAPQEGTALEPPRAEQLRLALEREGVATVTRPDDAVLFSVAAAVTGVRLAVAETGTLVCVSGPRSARGASLIPPVHVAVVGAGQLVPDLFDAFERIGAETPRAANVNLITGPSKTADIEGVLVTGVHGPGVVHVLLIAQAG